MPIDPSIILGVKPARVADPLEGAQKSLALQGLLGQQEMQRMQLDQARRAEADEQAVKEAYRQSGGDSNALRALLTGRGAYKQIQALDKADLEKRNTEAQIGQRTAQADKAKYDIAIDKIQRGASILSTAQDQASYDSARRQLAMTLGPEVLQGMPDQFDPRFVQAKIAEGQTIAQRLADQRARETQQITIRGQDMTQQTAVRGQDMTAATAREGQRVTMRGQDIGAATARRGQDLQYDPRLVETRAEAQARGKEFGESRAQSQLALPQTIATAERAIKLVDDIVKHPGFSTTVGATALPGARFVPGTDAADFQARLDEIKGGQFLQAFESLKGGGQITQVEGEKATQAISRMSLSQSEKEFRTAAKEFQDVVRAGLARARSKAGQAQSSGASAEFGTPAAAPPVRGGGIKFIGFE
jgi:hypothetical protein